MAAERILVVEDEQITALDLCSILSELGHEVVASVAHGEHAIEKAMLLQPTLVLMDIHLAGDMLGTEAADVIHHQLAIPVIFLTAYTDSQTMDEALSALPYGYVVKPFEPRDIDAAIRVAMVRYRADEDIRISSERLAIALKSAKMAVWDWDPDISEQLPEPDAIEAKGFEWTFHEMIERLHSDDASELRQALAESPRCVRLVRVRKQAEEYRWHRLFATVVTGKGKRRRVAGLLQDVHDEQQAQQALVQAGVVFESSSEGLLITDADMNIERVNPAFEQITGYSTDELVGQQPETLLSARRSDDMPIQMAIVGDSWSGEVVCCRKNGDVFPAWEHVTRIRNEHGQPGGFVVNLSDISRLRRAEQRLTKMALLDHLTGLGNRMKLEQSLEEVLTDQTDGKAIGLLFLDLDGFKLINDTLGHGEGDRLLKEIASRLRDNLREDDLVARVGGDEFVVLVGKSTSLAGMEYLAAKILTLIASPIQLSRQAVQVSASIGLVVSDMPGRSADELMRAADTAMFEAKRMGKNCYCLYDFNLDQEYQQRLRIESDLRDAVSREEFLIGYQPVMNAETGQLHGAEALIRWEHPELGLLLPGRFIHIAESSDVIVKLGNWVLEQSCRTAADWHKLGLDVVMSVNVSARQMADEGLPAFVEQCLKKYQLPPTALDLEMTETALQSNHHLLPQLRSIRKLGVSLSIDDFGTGYSSLGRLKELPFDRVKIDRSFVTGLPDNVDDLEICKAIMALCKVLGLAVTAEGVENEAQRHVLKSIGCDCLQGFLFSSDVPREEIPRLASAAGF